jgi:hypothetical protein
MMHHAAVCQEKTIVVWAALTLSHDDPLGLSLVSKWCPLEAKVGQIGGKFKIATHRRLQKGKKAGFAPLL